MPEQVRCPSCEAKLRVPDSLLGASVKCPKCQSTFTAEVEAPAEPEEGIAREPAPSAGARRRPLPPEDMEEEAPPPDDEFEDEDRPRRRRRRRRGRSSLEAESAVAGPAIALMVVSGLGIALAILSLLLNLLGAGLAAAGPGGARQGDAAVNAVAGIGGAVFALLYWGVVLTGAMKMKSLSSYGFAMTACIVAMLPCSICCLLGLPFGIWGLVVLNKPEVKEAFS